MRILPMLENEQFIGFVDFNSYQEIAFNPINLRIECCSNFLFLTRRENEYGRFLNHLNLLLLDPFDEKLDAAIFTSSTVIDNELYNNSDMIIKSVIQNNRSNNIDENCNVYVWSQAPNKLIRSKLLTVNSSKVQEDSDNFDADMIDIKQEDF